MLSEDDLKLLLDPEPTSQQTFSSSGGRVFSDDELDALLGQAADDAEALTAKLLGKRDDEEEEAADEAENSSTDAEDEAAAPPQDNADEELLYEPQLQDSDEAGDPEQAADEVEQLIQQVEAAQRMNSAAVTEPAAGEGATSNEADLQAAEDETDDVSDEDVSAILSRLEELNGQAGGANEPAGRGDDEAPVASAPAAAAAPADADSDAGKAVAAPAADSNSVNAPAAQASAQPVPAAEPPVRDETLTRADLDALLANAQPPITPEADQAPAAAAPKPPAVDDAPMVMDMAQLDELLASRAEHKTAAADAASDLPLKPHEIEQEEAKAPKDEAPPKADQPAAAGAEAPAPAPAMPRPAMPPAFSAASKNASPAAPAATGAAAAAPPAASAQAAPATSQPAAQTAGLGPVVEPSLPARWLYILLSILNRPFENASSTAKSIAAIAAASLLFWTLLMLIAAMMNNHH